MRVATGNWRRGLHRLYLGLWAIWALAILVPNVSRFHYVSPEDVRAGTGMEQTTPPTTDTLADGSLVGAPALPPPPPSPGWHADFTAVDVVWIFALALVFPGALYVAGRWVARGFRST